MAGLAAAKTLVAAGREVLVLEAGDGVGGRVRTDVIDGFRCDRGFQVVLTAYPELTRQLDVPALRLHTFEPGALVWTSGRGHVVGDPARQPRTAVSTAMAPIGSVADKVHLLQARRRWTTTPIRDLLGQPDRSTATALADAGFSPTAVKRFLGPLLGGIQLDRTLSSSFRMADTVMAMLARGSAAVPSAGMGAIPAQLADALPPGVVHLDTEVVSLSPTSVRLASGRSIDATAVVVATEGPVAARLAGLPPVESRPAGCIWFAMQQAPTTHRLIVLDGDDSGPALNVAVMSNVAPGYAPAGWHLVAAATPGDIGPDLAERVRAQLRGWWGTSVDTWRVVAEHRIAHAQPAHGQRLQPKQRVDLGGGLFVCGDHRDTPSIQGALYSGRRCGEAVAAFVAAHG